MTDLDVAPVTTTVPVTNDEGDHERFAHVVVPASAVTRAYITGEMVTALCGKTWVPTKDPERFPLCPTCGDILKAANTADREK